MKRIIYFSFILDVHILFLVRNFFVKCGGFSLLLIEFWVDFDLILHFVWMIKSTSKYIYFIHFSESSSGYMIFWHFNVIIILQMSIYSVRILIIYRMMKIEKNLFTRVNKTACVLNFKYYFVLINLTTTNKQFSSYSMIWVFSFRLDEISKITGFWLIVRYLAYSISAFPIDKLSFECWMSKCYIRLKKCFMKTQYFHSVWSDWGWHFS